MSSSPSSRPIVLLSAAALVLLAGILIYRRQDSGTVGEPIVTPVARYAAPAPGVRLDEPSPLAAWPWPNVKPDTPHRGVTHWLARSGDGTVVELFDFDFGTNPGLRLELFDQDEDDAVPFDNKTHFWPRGVGHIVRGLNTKFKASGSGTIVAAWNGPFFGYYERSSAGQAAGLANAAHHVAPVVLRGKVFYNTGNHRWTFGVKYQNGRPVFKVFHLPGRDKLAKEFDYAGGSVQCLILNGEPLKMQPFPQPGSAVPKQPVKSTPQEAGHVPDFDHMKSCRVSMAWSRDNKHLYLLFVKETDTEGGSIAALRQGKPMGSGWMLSDVQNFWLALGKTKSIWGAINSDAGDAAQLAYLRPDGKYDLVPERMANPAMRLTFTPDFKNAPQGGTLMTFYVRDGGVTR